MTVIGDGARGEGADARERVNRGKALGWYVVESLRFGEFFKSGYGLPEIPVARPWPHSSNPGRR